MKSALFAVAIAISGTALAQTGTTTTTPMTTTSTMSSGQTVAPGNEAPERDARGIPVVSDPATAPTGFNEPPQVGGTGAPPSATPTTMPADQNYPPCTREVTDNCVQTYERGRAPE